VTYLLTLSRKLRAGNVEFLNVKAISPLCFKELNEAGYELCHLCLLCTEHYMAINRFEKSSHFDKYVLPSSFAGHM
jgi:hypothetical protein